MVKDGADVDTELGIKYGVVVGICSGVKDGGGWCGGSYIYS